MPTLRLGVVCEKVIVDANGVPSAIGLFSQFNINVPHGTTFPENAVAPKEWAMLFIWECSPDEVGREFSQIFEVTTPSGQQFGPASTIKFVAQREKLRQNVIANSQGIPIGLSGRVTVTTRLELGGQAVAAPMTLGFDVVLIRESADKAS